MTHAAESEQTIRWARRESLLVLLTRVQHGRTLTGNEARALREHVETEMREAETARLRTEETQAALDRVRRIHSRGRQTNACNDCGQPWPCEVTRALDGTGPAPAVTEGTDAEHLGGGANAEDCPACDGTNPPYPFICPGPAAMRPPTDQPKER